MNTSYNDESRNEYDRIFGLNKPKLKFIRVDGSIVEIDVNEITEEPIDVSTFNDKNRILITCGDYSEVVRGDYDEIGLAIYNAWRK